MVKFIYIFTTSKGNKADRNFKLKEVIKMNDADNLRVDVIKGYTQLNRLKIQEYFKHYTNKSWLNSYYSMISGAWGEVTIEDDDVCEIEISRFDTDSGNPKIFTWENIEGDV